MLYTKLIKALIKFMYASLCKNDICIIAHPYIYTHRHASHSERERASVKYIDVVYVTDIQVIQRGTGPRQNNTDVVYVINMQVIQRGGSWSNNIDVTDMQVIQRGRESWSNNIDVVYVINMQVIQRGGSWSIISMYYMLTWQFNEMISRLQWYTLHVKQK